jgi:hypothetical protein
MSAGGQGKAHSRPVVPLDRHPELPLFWQYGHYLNYLEYRTALVAGDHGDHLDAQYYIRAPELKQGHHAVFYVYYGNWNAADQSSDPAEVWWGDCRIGFHGSLTPQDLRYSTPAEADGLTVEVTATWASDRKGRD